MAAGRASVDVVFCYGDGGENSPVFARGSSNDAARGTCTAAALVPFGTARERKLTEWWSSRSLLFSRPV